MTVKRAIRSISQPMTDPPSSPLHPTPLLNRICSKLRCHGIGCRGSKVLILLGGPWDASPDILDLSDQMLLAEEWSPFFQPGLQSHFEGCCFIAALTKRTLEGYAQCLLKWQNNWNSQWNSFTVFMRLLGDTKKVSRVKNVGFTQ